jgi:hypothetical protein
MKETLFFKVCRGTTPFCLDLEKKDHYILDSEKNSEKKTDE